MSRLLLCGLLAMLLIPGCGKKTAESESAEHAEEQAEAAQHQEYERQIDQKLVEYNARIDSLKTQMNGASEKTKVKLREDIADLEVERDKVQSKLGELRASAANVWNDAKAALVLQLDSLDRKFDRARERMH